MQSIKVGQFQVAQVNGAELGVVSQTWSEAGWSSCSVRLLRTFSWDAKDRAFLKKSQRCVLRT